MKEKKVNKKGLQFVSLPAQNTEGPTNQNVRICQ